MTAEQLDHDIDIGTRDQRRSVARDQFRGQSGNVVGLEASIRDARQLERRAEDAFVFVGIAQQQFHHAAAHGTASEQGNPYRFQFFPRFFRDCAQEPLAALAGISA